MIAEEEMLKKCTGESGDIDDIANIDMRKFAWQS